MLNLFKETLTIHAVIEVVSELVFAVGFHTNVSSWEVMESSQVLSTCIFGIGDSIRWENIRRWVGKYGRRVDVSGMGKRWVEDKCCRSSDLKVVGVPCHGKCWGA